MACFDVTGAAQDLEKRAFNWAPYLQKYPHLMICYRLLTRNPWAAKEVVRALESIIASHPERAVATGAPIHFKRTS